MMNINLHWSSEEMKIKMVDLHLRKRKNKLELESKLPKKFINILLFEFLKSGLFLNQWPNDSPSQLLTQILEFPISKNLILMFESSLISELHNPKSKVCQWLKKIIEDLWKIIKTKSIRNSRIFIRCEVWIFWPKIQNNIQNIIMHLQEEIFH